MRNGMDSGWSFLMRPKSYNRVSLFTCTYGTIHEILVSLRSALGSVAVVSQLVVTIAFKSVDVRNSISSCFMFKMIRVKSSANPINIRSGTQKLNSPLLPFGAISVSYTHLDVYKRQALTFT